MIFVIEGRCFTIIRDEDETDPMFAERSSFIMSFRNHPDYLTRAIKYSGHHVKKMFLGVVYKAEIEVAVKELRELHLKLREQDEKEQTFQKV